MPTRNRVLPGLLLLSATFWIGSPWLRAQQLGLAAPDFTLSNIEGKQVQLKDYRGKKNVALVFYPALFRAGG